MLHIVSINNETAGSDLHAQSLSLAATMPQITRNFDLISVSEIFTNNIVKKKKQFVILFYNIISDKTRETDIGERR